MKYLFSIILVILISCKKEKITINTFYPVSFIYNGDSLNGKAHFIKFPAGDQYFYTLDCEFLDPTFHKRHNLTIDSYDPISAGTKILANELGDPDQLQAKMAPIAHLVNYFHENDGPSVHYILTEKDIDNYLVIDNYNNSRVSGSLHATFFQGDYRPYPGSSGDDTIRISDFHFDLPIFYPQ